MNFYQRIFNTNIWKLTITYPGHSEIQTQNLSKLLWRNGKLFNFAKTILLFAYKFDLLTYWLTCVQEF